MTNRCPFTYGTSASESQRTWNERDHLHNKAAIMAQRFGDWAEEMPEGETVEHSPRLFSCKRLLDVRAIRGYVDAAEREIVAEARENGMSWEDIGAQLGTSRQAAHKRWG